MADLLQTGHRSLFLNLSILSPPPPQYTTAHMYRQPRYLHQLNALWQCLVMPLSSHEVIWRWHSKFHTATVELILFGVEFVEGLSLLKAVFGMIMLQKIMALMLSALFQNGKSTAKSMLLIGNRTYYNFQERRMWCGLQMKYAIFELQNLNSSSTPIFVKVHVYHVVLAQWSRMAYIFAK